MGMSQEHEARPSQVGGSTADGSECAPLRDCVHASLQKYFADLNGCKAGHLHALVMREVEQPLLKCVLEYTRGNQSEAAKILGLNRSTLRKKLRSYDLNR